MVFYNISSDKLIISFSICIYDSSCPLSTTEMLTSIWIDKEAIVSEFTSAFYIEENKHSKVYREGFYLNWKSQRPTLPELEHMTFYGLLDVPLPLRITKKWMKALIQASDFKSHPTFPHSSPNNTCLVILHASLNFQFIYSLSRYLLRIYFMPLTVLGVWNTLESQKGKGSHPHKIHIVIGGGRH